MAGKMNRFLTNMLFSGIITHKDGINYMWHNPFIFFPSRAFAVFYNALRQEMGEDIDELFYWLGFLQGTNSTKILQKRFGFKNINDFIDGANIIGMGNLVVLEKDDDKYGLISGENSVLALRVKEINPNTNYAVDSYLSGIIAGGAHILYNRMCKCTETKCIGKGDDRCLYEVIADSSYEYNAIKDKIHKLEEIKEKISKFYLLRTPYFKLALNKQFSVDNGRFLFKNYEGFNIEVYLVILLELFLGEYYTETYQKALDKMFNEELNLVFGNAKYGINLKSFEKVFSEIALFGYGYFSVRAFRKNVLYVESHNNIFVNEYKSFFGKIGVGNDIFMKEFFKVLLKNLFNTNAEVKNSVENKVGGSSSLISVINF